MPKANVQIVSHSSAVLKSNPLKDPFERDVYIYLPPGFRPEKTYPALLALNGFTGTGANFFNFDPFLEDLGTRMDRLIREGKCAETIIVAPDCFTKLGGSQFLNSSAVGTYEDYLMQEIIPFVETHYSISNWGVFGKSSGGYGAIRLGLKFSDRFRAIGMHSGDCAFELSYLPDFGKALNAFRKCGGPQGFLDKVYKDVNRKRKGYIDTLNILAMSACYSPDPSKEMGIDFPFDLETGIFKPEIWERWRKWDPIHFAPLLAKQVKVPPYIYIDCGSQDEFYLQWGARALVKILKDINIPAVYEEFEDGHMGVNYRHDVSLPLLTNALKNLR